MSSFHGDTLHWHEMTPRVDRQLRFDCYRMQDRGKMLKDVLRARNGNLKMTTAMRRRNESASIS